MRNRKIPLICLCAPSGVGKSAIAGGSYLTEIISFTSRPIRNGEVDGVHYHFRTLKWMKEHKDMFTMDFKKVHGNYYSATDIALRTKELFVVNLRDAIDFKKNGMPVYIIYIIGECRAVRKGRVEDAKAYNSYRSANLEYIDYFLNNNGSLEDAINILERKHKLLIGGSE